MERAKVTFAYTAEDEDEDEISIAVDDIVVVVDKSDANWWRGHLVDSADTVGLFPASCVELLEGTAIASASVSEPYDPDDHFPPVTTTRSLSERRIERH